MRPVAIVLVCCMLGFSFPFMLCVNVCPGYGDFDSYNGFNNYCFGNGMFDERVRGERGGRGKVQILFTLWHLSYAELMFERLSLYCQFNTSA